MQSFHNIPALGLGTYPLQGSDCENAVRMAIDVGIRHIDTAQMYGNESSVGKAVAQCGISRTEFFIVTKIDPSNLSEAKFLHSAEKSADDLGGPADLLLIHWPPADAYIAATVQRLVSCHSKGLCRAIGVSNFSIAMMKQAQDIAEGSIVNNQIEFHPLLNQQKILAAAKTLNITLSAYSPIAKGAALQNPIIQTMAKKYQRPASEIVLRWITQQDVCAIPMTTKRENAQSNLNSQSFDLAPEDMAIITALGTNAGRTISPASMNGRWDI